MSLTHTVLDVFVDQQAVKMLSWVTLVFIILVVVVFTGFYALTYRRTDDRDEEHARRGQRSRTRRKCGRRRTSPRAGGSPGDRIHGGTSDGHAPFARPPSSTSSGGARPVDENGPSKGTAAACRNKRPGSSGETGVQTTVSASAVNRPRPDSSCDINNF